MINGAVDGLELETEKWRLNLLCCSGLIHNGKLTEELDRELVGGRQGVRRNLGGAGREGGRG